MKEQDEKYPLAKNEPVSANWWGDIIHITTIVLSNYYKSF